MKLSTFLALGTIAGVDLETTKEKDVLRMRKDRLNQQCLKKDWDYPARGGRLTKIVDNLTKICRGYIDKPAYQCRCLRKQKTFFWTFSKARRICLDKKNKWGRAQAKKNDRKNNRSKREIEENEDLIMDEDDEIFDQLAKDLIDSELSEMDDIESGGGITVEMIEALYMEKCDGLVSPMADPEEQEECDELREIVEDMKEGSDGRGTLTDDTKEHAEIIYRISRMHDAMTNWVRSYVSKGPYCREKQQNYVARIKNNRRRMANRRKLYATNPQKLKRKRKEERLALLAAKEDEAGL